MPSKPGVRANVRKRKSKPKRALPASATPHLCQIIGWDPGAQMGLAVLAFGRLTHFYAGPCDGIPNGFLRSVVEQTELPTVGVIEEHTPYGPWSDQAYRRLQQRVGMAEQQLYTAGVSRIVHVFPGTWRKAFGIKAKGESRGEDCRALAKLQSLALYAKDGLTDDKPPDVYEATLIATWGERAGEVGALLK